MSFLVLRQNPLRPCVLLGNHLEHLVVHHLGGSLRIRLLEIVYAVVVIADVRQLVTHSGIGNHSVDALRHPFQGIDGTRRDMPREEFLGSTSAKQ